MVFSKKKYHYFRLRRYTIPIYNRCLLSITISFLWLWLWVINHWNYRNPLIWQHTLYIAIHWIWIWKLILLLPLCICVYGIYAVRWTYQHLLYLPRCDSFEITMKFEKHIMSRTRAHIFNDGLRIFVVVVRSHHFIVDGRRCCQ